MKRDLAVSRADKDGYISYEILPTYDITNSYEAFGHKYLKLLLSDQYGGLLESVRRYKTSAKVSTCVANTDKEIKRLAAVYPDSLYTLYDSYLIKKLDINTATSSLILEIGIVFKGGSVMTVTL